MKYLYEYKQTVLFPNLRPFIFEESIKDFITKHKSDKEILGDDHINIENILQTYSFEKLSLEVFNEDMMNEDIFYYIEYSMDIINEYISKTNSSYMEELTPYFNEKIIKGEDLFEYLDIDDFLNWYTKTKYINWYEIIDPQYYNKLIDLLDGDTLTIYRSININKDGEKHKEYDGVGVFWSYDYNGAISHNGNFSDEHHQIILKAEINIRNIDWHNTLYKSIYNLSDEEEIQTLEGVTVSLIGYVLNDAIDEYINVKKKQYLKYLKTLKQFKDISDYQISKMFADNGKYKYNIELSDPINIFV
jgi:hypothetical protein